jgi:hypothetical protein
MTGVEQRIRPRTATCDRIVGRESSEGTLLQRGSQRQWCRAARAGLPRLDRRSWSGAGLGLALILGIACGRAVRATESVAEFATALSTDQVIVREFDTTAIETNRFDGAVDRLGLQVAEAIVHSLREAGIPSRLGTGAELPAGRYLIEGRVAFVDGGNRVLRLALLGTGAVVVETEGRIVDGERNVVASFESVGREFADLAAGGSSESLIHRCVDTIGADIAESLAGLSRNVPAESPLVWDPGLYAPTHEDAARSRPHSRRPPDRSIGERIDALRTLRAEGLLTDSQFARQKERLLR